MRAGVFAATLMIALAACADGTAAQGESAADEVQTEQEPEQKRALGLKTSLPLYWPLAADFSAIANGTAPEPWQRAAIEEQFDIVPLDTLHPIPAIQKGDAPPDPLEGLSRIAIIQPRSFSPADNVVIDDWVRAGGELLLILDPQLTGEYQLALGDPRMPALTALIPPVLARWGLAMTFDEAQAREPRQQSLQAQSNGAQSIPVLMSGSLARVPSDNQPCRLEPGAAIALCTIGEGRVTLLADAAIFEHRALGVERSAAIEALLRFAFD